jgi:hypothetical protein
LLEYVYNHSPKVAYTITTNLSIVITTRQLKSEINGGYKPSSVSLLNVFERIRKFALFLHEVHIMKAY